jgi:hypothetical protein
MAMTMAIPPNSADTARPLIAPGGPTLPVAPLAQRLASGPPNSQIGSSPLTPRMPFQRFHEEPPDGFWTT